MWISGNLRQNRLRIAFEIFVYLLTSIFVSGKFDPSWLPVVEMKKAYDCALNECLIKFERNESNLTKYTSCDHKNFKICQSVYKLDFPKKHRTHLITEFYLECLHKLMPHSNIS